jgi:copper chaperone CopZ
MLIFNLPDMSCGHCEKTVRKTIATVDPDAQVAVDLATRTIRIESSADAGAIADALKAQGYPSR